MRIDGAEVAIVNRLSTMRGVSADHFDPPMVKAPHLHECDSDVSGVSGEVEAKT
jgi:hypothetical protein